MVLQALGETRHIGVYSKDTRTRLRSRRPRTGHARALQPQLCVRFQTVRFWFENVGQCALGIDIANSCHNSSFVCNVVA